MKRIAIQGVPGSYHDIAAHKYFNDEEIELICCNTFEEVFSSIRHDSNVIGMIAIEIPSPEACSITTNSCATAVLRS